MITSGCFKVKGLELNFSTDSGLCSIQKLGKTRNFWKASNDWGVDDNVRVTAGGVMGDWWWRVCGR